MEPQGYLDAHPGGADRGSLDRGNRPDRQQLHQGPPLFRWRKRGVRANAIGISRGGRTTKIHALVDVLGRPLRLVLTPGNTSDVKGANLLIGETVGMKRVIADRGYDANRIRAALREQGTIPAPPVVVIESAQSSMTNTVTMTAGGSRPCSAASKTSAASLPATIYSPGISSQPQASQPPRHSGSVTSLEPKVVTILISSNQDPHRFPREGLESTETSVSVLQ